MRVLLFAALSAARAPLVTAQCIVTTLAGGGATGNSSGVSNGSGTAALFYQPIGLTVNASGSLIVADSYNHRVRVITPTGVVSTLAGQSVAGTNDGTGTNSRFNIPAGVAISTAGDRMWVADYNSNRVRLIAGTVVTVYAGGGGTGITGGSSDGTGNSRLFTTPRGVALGASGTLYVADGGNHKIRALTSDGTLLTTLAGGGSGGTTSGSVNGVGTAALFSNPASIAVDITGSFIVVADSLNHKVRAITPAGVVTTLAGGGSTGSSSGFFDGVGTAALFNAPRGVAVDASGTAFVADVANSRIRIITSSGVVTTLAGGGSTGTLSGFSDGVGTAALFSGASGVAVDVSGTLFVTDYSNHKIRVLSNCTSCAAGNFCPTGSPDSAQLCPPGHYCPAGSTRWSDKNCGRGNYCPWGSSEPTSCGPKGVVDATLGPANGPAFSTEVASCRNHCFFGAPGQLSTCG